MTKAEFIAKWIPDRQSYINLNDYLEKVKYHYCVDWDYLNIDKNDPEFNACMCFKNIQPELF